MTAGSSTRRWVLRPGLSGRAWLAERPRANVLLMHGLAEYAERYVSCHAGLIPALTAAGVNVFAFDMTGHGGSVGPRAVTDVAVQIAHHRLARRLLGSERQPLFLFGHSLGGLVAAASVAEDPTGIAGVVLSSPALMLPGSPGLRLVSRVLAAIVPGLGVRAMQDAVGLSRIAAAVQAYREDTNIPKRRVSALVAASALSSAHRMWPRLREWTVPVAIVHGTADRFADVGGSDLFSSTVRGDCLYRRIDDGQHELLNDLGGEALREELVEWIVARTSSGGPTTPHGTEAQGRRGY